MKVIYHSNVIFQTFKESIMKTGVLLKSWMHERALARVAHRLQKASDFVFQTKFAYKHTNLRVLLHKILYCNIII